MLKWHDFHTPTLFALLEAPVAGSLIGGAGIAIFSDDWTNLGPVSI